MLQQFLRFTCGALPVCLCLALGVPARGNSTVAAGWDLFETVPAATTFMGVPLQGVPLGTFDFDNAFGRGIGVQNVGMTDTIVQRLSDATVPSTPGSATVPLQMVALQLETLVPVNLGLGTDFYFITLQSARPTGGTPSTGQMAITFANDLGGTFNSFFDVFFDLRKGSLTGPIAQSGDVILQAGGVPWTRTPPPGSLTINGVNHFLDGNDTNQDFWPLGVVTESGPNAMHVVINTPADTPLPTAAWGGLALLALVGLLSASHSTRRRTAARA